MGYPKRKLYRKLDGPGSELPNGSGEIGYMTEGRLPKAKEFRAFFLRCKCHIVAMCKRERRP